MVLSDCSPKGITLAPQPPQFQPHPLGILGHRPDQPTRNGDRLANAGGGLAEQDLERGTVRAELRGGEDNLVGQVGHRPSKRIAMARSASASVRPTVPIV
jgi:hypothetical protein